MSTANLSSEVEQVREKLAADFAAEEGKDWAEPFRPGTFGCHELLDRTAMFAQLVEVQIQSHPACVANTEWFATAERAVAALNHLYQQIGAEHMQAEDA